MTIEVGFACQLIDISFILYHVWETPKKVEQMKIRPFIQVISNTVLMLIVSACSTYQSKPLPTKPAFAKRNVQVTIRTASLPFPKTKPHRINVAQGLDMTDVAMLAVVNDPLLKVARDDAKVAAAQAFSARLLPDPQFHFDRLFPINPGVKGFDTALSYDFTALLTYNTKKNAAIEAEQQTNLNVLWQEWQVIIQAETLFNQIVSERAQLKVFLHYYSVISLAYQRIQQALQERNATLSSVGTQLLALQSGIQQINTIEQHLHQNQYALNKLLNLAPKTKLTLNPVFPLKSFNVREVKQALHNLALRRPDLLALKAGYKSQDLKYRQAIINQFPTLNIGFTRSTDTTDAKYYGFGVTLNLPLFNANRGNVAIEKATRQKLYDDFQQRLNAAYNDVYRILDQQNLLLTQYQQAKLRMKTLESLASSANITYQHHDMTIIDYSAIVINLIHAKLIVLSLKQLLNEQRIALQTLLGPWSEVRPPHKTRSNP